MHAAWHKWGRSVTFHNHAFLVQGAAEPFTYIAVTDKPVASLPDQQVVRWRVFDGVVQRDGNRICVVVLGLGDGIIQHV